MEEKRGRCEGTGWRAHVGDGGKGVVVPLAADDELWDDLIRRFEAWVDRKAA